MLNCLPMKRFIPRPYIQVADEVWIAMALLHREQPGRPDFTIQEIVERVEKENLYGSLRPGVRVHTKMHRVANKVPSHGAYTMLYATGRHTRRLFRPSDLVHPERSGKVTPNRDEIPPKYHKLLDWYESEFVQAGSAAEHPFAALLALQGTGKEIWKGEDADEYVRRLREGWG